MYFPPRNLYTLRQPTLFFWRIVAAGESDAHQHQAMPGRKCFQRPNFRIDANLRKNSTILRSIARTSLSAAICRGARKNDYGRAFSAIPDPPVRRPS